MAYTKKARIAYITLNPPEGNAFDEILAGDLADVCRQVKQDGDVYAVLLTGSGDAFGPGGESDGLTPLSGHIAAIEQPVVAAINGDALGPGLELALACDVRIAARQARFGFPEVSRGLIPGDGGTQRLPRIIGKGKALELILSSRVIGAEEALEIGLVSRLADADKLAAEAGALAEAIAGKSPIAVRYVKEAVNKGLDLTLEQGLRLEADLYFLIHTTRDRAEGIRAFLEKRPPQFKNE